MGGGRQEGTVLELASFIAATDGSFISHRPGPLGEVHTYILSSSLLIEAPTSAHISVTAKERQVETSCIFYHRTTESQNLRLVILKIIWSIRLRMLNHLHSILANYLSASTLASPVTELQQLTMTWSGLQP